MGLLRESIVGADGKGSSKNFTALWIVILVTVLHVIFMVIGYRIVDKVVPTEQSLKVMDRLMQLISINYTVLLILFGLVSVQTILQALNIFRGKGSSPVEVVTNTQTTTQVIPTQTEEVKKD